MSDRTKVLFLCTRNSARSQMAEAFLRHYGGDRYEVHSAGLVPGEVDPMTVQVMAERGLDLSDQQAKGIDRYLGKMLFQYLIIMCAKAEKNCPTVWPGVNERLSWPVEDPGRPAPSEAERLADFRAARDQIEQMVQTWVGENSERQ
ncbi:MAG: arsenate reductase ArsC [Thermoleophilia bacterium]|nr:arsenate reductase ArsC [Thermoleophilia bacterium]